MLVLTCLGEREGGIEEMKGMNGVKGMKGVKRVNGMKGMLLVRCSTSYSL